MRFAALAILIGIALTVSLCGCLNLNPSPEEELGQVQGLDVEATTVYLGLTWLPLDGADHYRIMRDGELLTETKRLHLNDSKVEDGITYNYQVCGVRDIFPFGTKLGEMSEQSSGMLIDISYDDDGFREFVVDTGNLIQGLCYDIQEAGMKMDLSISESLSQRLEEVSSEYLFTSHDFNVSDDLAPAIEEYRLAMEDFILAGQYINQGVSSLDQGMIEQGIDFSYQGAEHMRNVTSLL